MKPWLLIAFFCGTVPAVAKPQDLVNQDALILQNLTKRIAEYVRLHSTMALQGAR